jgi:hypothetical protein
MNNKYVGHELQYRGVEEMRIAFGRGEGMKILQIRNGKGLEMMISLDRCADIPRLSCCGVNYGFFSPCGYCAPQFYDKNEFLRNFTAGFLTTCGLATTGAACEYNGESLPMHGTIANQPAEWYMYETLGNEIIVKAKIRDAVLFGRKFILTRTYRISLDENIVIISDEIENIGTEKLPLMLLYHFNMGYPLLSEKAVLDIPHTSVRPHNKRAADGISSCLVVEKPQDGFEEQCYYYDVIEKDGFCQIGISNEENGAKLQMRWKADALDCFTQWKMMGSGEYVMGFEPGNCTPEGCAAMEKAGKLKLLGAGEKYVTEIILKCSR